MLCLNQIFSAGLQAAIEDVHLRLPTHSIGGFGLGMAEVDIDPWQSCPQPFWFWQVLLAARSLK
jgi:hypothetical protein